MELAYTLPINRMNRKIDNFLKVYHSDSNLDKKKLISKLMELVDDTEATKKEELIRLINSLSNKVKSEDVDLAIIKKIIEKID